MARSATIRSRIVPRFMSGSTLFNGSTSKIDCGAINPVGTGDKTISFWANPTSNGEGTFGRVIDDGKFLAYIDTDGLYVGNTGTTSRVTTGLPWGKWRHYTIVRSTSGSVSAYVNGSLSSLGAVACGTPTAASTNFFIGNRPAEDRTFNGKIAEVKIFNSVLTAAQALELYTTGSVSGVTPVASYALDDQPSTYIDSIGGNNGTGTATTFSDDTPLQKRLTTRHDNSSLGFNGSTTKVAATTLSALTTNSFSAWFYASAYNGVIIASTTGATDRRVIAITSAGIIVAGVYNNVSWSSYTSSTRAIQLNRWYHVSVSIGSNVGASGANPAYMYLNGILQTGTTSPGAQAASTAALMVGTRTSSAADFFKGKIYNARVYDRELTATEMRDMYFSNIVPASPVVEYVLTEGAGTTAYDSSGNGNNGTITGATWSSDTPSKARTVVGGNLVKNGDFSYAPVVNVAQVSTNWVDGTSGGSSTNSLFGWRVQTSTGTNEVKFDSEEKYSGLNSLKISTKATGSLVLVMNSVSPFTSAGFAIPVLPSTAYTLIYRMKTRVVSGAANTGASMVISERSATGSLVTETSGTAIKTTTDWTLYTVALTTNSATRFIAAKATIIGNDGTATLIMDAWFDDITLTKTTPQTRTAV